MVSVECMLKKIGMGVYPHIAFLMCQAEEAVTAVARGEPPELLTVTPTPIDYTDKKNPPISFHWNNIKQGIDELLPALIILAHKRPEIKDFYKNLFDFCSKLPNRSSWVGQWMGFKLTCMLLERFGLLWLGGASSYDMGLSWAFGVISATEFLSDIQVGDVLQQIVKAEK